MNTNAMQILFEQKTGGRVGVPDIVIERNKVACEKKEVWCWKTDDRQT